MKQRLCIVFAFVTLATAIVMLDCQLRCAQMELQGSADVQDELSVAIAHMTARAQPAVQKTSNKGPDRVTLPGHP
jgi:hypothetical protein